MSADLSHTSLATAATTANHAKGGDSMGRKETTQAGDMVTLSPYALAEILGVDRGDAGLLSTAPVRLPLDFIDGWKSRVGPLEMSVSEVSLLTGVPIRTLIEWCKSGQLVSRRLRSKGRGYRIAPANLISLLREKNQGPTPTVAETPTQEKRRADAGQKRLAAMCRGKAVAGYD